MHEKSLSTSEFIARRMELLRQATKRNLGGEVKLDESLAPHASLRLGGKADIFVLVRKEEDLRRWAALAQELALPYRVIGGGTNLLVSDHGFPGLVIENRIHGLRIDPQKSTVVAASGQTMANLARVLAKEAWAGLEWGAGIPGTVGGAVVNNAGAHGGEVAERLQNIHMITDSGEEREISAGQLRFAYRRSRLKGQGSAAGTLLTAQFGVERGNPYQLLERIAEMDEHRRRTQPKEANVGSIFKNPPQDFAGRLIESAGLKGLTVGRAQISPLHANFFINLGGARAGDVLALIRTARQAVAEKFGVVLELEIEPFGEWEEELEEVIP